MKKNSLSVSMDAALKAWALRHATDASTSAQIAAHAVAHGVSSTGLLRALQRAGLVKPAAATEQPQGEA